MTRFRLLVALLVSGCGFSFQPDKPSAPVDTGEATGPADGSAYTAAARADLRVKRWRQLSLDLEGALQLTCPLSEQVVSLLFRAS